MQRHSNESDNRSHDAGYNIIERSQNRPIRDCLDVGDIQGTKSKRLYHGQPTHLMDKYNTVEQSKPKLQTKLRNRGFYDNLDYRDVTRVKKNGMDSPESSNYRLKMSYEKLNRNLGIFNIFRESRRSNI